MLVSQFPEEEILDDPQEKNEYRGTEEECLAHERAVFGVLFVFSDGGPFELGFPFGFFSLWFGRFLCFCLFLYISCFARLGFGGSLVASRDCRRVSGIDDIQGGNGFFMAFLCRFFKIGE